MRGFAMASERGDMADSSEAMLTGDDETFPRRESRKRDEGTAASRRKSGRRNGFEDSAEAEVDDAVWDTGGGRAGRGLEGC